MKLLSNEPCTVLITGRRGAGKTSLGHLLLSQSRFENKYVILPVKGSIAWNNMPPEIEPVLFDKDVIDRLPQDAVVFIDDSSTYLYARDSGKLENKLMDKAILKSRQKGQTLIFGSHNTRKLDPGVLSDMDAIFFKEPSFLHSKMERKEFKVLSEKAKALFSKISKKERVKYVYRISDDGEAFIKIGQPGHWNESLGMVWRIDESPKKEDKQIAFENKSIDYTEKVYRVLVDAGYPVTIQAIKKKIGGGITVNDVIRAINKLSEAKTISIVKDKSPFDKYMA